MPKAKILVVDDDPAIGKVVKSRLEVNGYEVIIAEDGEEGIRKAKKELPDLIIINVMMPKLSGITAVLNLQKDKRAEVIPVILLTGVPEAETQTLASRLNVTDYIIKPFEGQELVAKVEKALK